MEVTGPDVRKFYHLFPMSVVVIGVHARGRDNVMAAAWHCPISHSPPLYGVSISPKRFTYDLLREAGHFTANFLPFEKAEIIAHVGNVSGRDVDKFERFGLSRKEGSRIPSPILQEAYAALECELYDHKTLGDHVWCVGKVLALHFKPELFDQEGLIQLGRLKPVLYLGNDFYFTADPSSLCFLPE